MFLQGVGTGMRAVEAVIRELAQSNVTVLLLAEAGAGKRTVARYIHESSVRSAEPFCFAACAGVTPQDFSGMSRNGTVFLEEIGDLSSGCQAVLLDLLPQLETNGNGSRRARFIGGSARNLEADVKQGRFREDLYYGISGVCLRLPPLRQRKEDIPVLRDWFLSTAARDFCRAVPVLSPETQNFFLEYNWPGNIRELKDAARAIVGLGDETLAMGGLRSLLRRVDRSG